MGGAKRLAVLIIAAGLSLVLNMSQALEADTIYLLYCVTLTLWFTGFRKHWVRTEAYYINKWGMDRMKSQEEIHDILNPDFIGEMKPWPLDENIEVEQPFKQKLVAGRLVSAIGTPHATSRKPDPP